MNKSFSISLVWLLVFCTIIAYTGVPFYTMICKQDGHVQRAFIKTHAACEHEHQEIPEEKSCCKTESSCESSHEEDCCDFNSNYLKIETPATIKSEQDHEWSPLLIAFTQYLFLAYTASVSDEYSDFSVFDSPFLNQQCHRTFTGVFRI